MKTYDETIDAIFSKGDALIEQRRQKAVKIKQTSYAVSGVCAAAIVGVGIWRMNDLKKLPDNRHSEIETVEEMTTTGTQTETATTTSPLVTDTVKNITASTSKNTVTSSSKTTTAKSTTKATTQSAVKTEITESASNETKNTETTAKQTTKHSETTTTQTEKAATIDTTTMTTVQPDTTTKTSITYDVTESTKETTRTTTAPADVTTTAPNGIGETTTTQFTDDITRKLPSIFNTIILAGTDSLDSKMRDQEFVYTYNLINEDDIDILLKEIHPNVNYEGNDIERDAHIYKIKRFSADAMIAVKFEGRDDYFLYCNKLYVPETLGEFISIFELDSDDYTKECYRGIMEANNISSEELWDIITGYVSLPDVSESCKGKDFRMQEAIWLELTADQRIIFKFGIDPHGYIIAGINTFIPDSYFCIGEEKAEEIIENYY